MKILLIFEEIVLNMNRNIKKVKLIIEKPQNILSFMS